MELIPDTVDLSAYMGGNDLSPKITEARAYGQKLRREFGRRDEKTGPEMFSTKMRSLLEFRPGEVTVWAGYNGHRKSMFTGQVALDLCVQNQRVMIASLEMAPQKTLARMARQASGAAHPSEQWLDAFSEWTTGRLWIFDHLGRINPESAMAVCRYFADKLQGKHVFIDSMMMVCASEESLDEQKQFMTDVVGMVKATGMHAHIVAHCRKPTTGEEKIPERYDLRGSAAISDQPDNIVTVWANRAKKAKLEENSLDQAALEQPDAVITVAKQRHGRYEGKLKLWFHEPSMRFADDRTSRIEPYVLQEAA